MKKTMIYFVTFAVVCLLLSPLAFCAELVNVQVFLNVDNGNVQISGRIINPNNNQKATLVVFKPDGDADKLSVSSSPFDIISTAEEMTVNDKGEFSYSYSIDGSVSGDYTVRITYGEQLVTQTLYYPTNEQRDGAIAAFNAAASDITKEALFGLFETNKNFLGLPLALYQTLGVSSDYQEAALRQVLQFNNYQAALEIVSEFKRAVALQALNKAANGTEVQALIDTYNNDLGLDIKGKLYSEYLSETSQRSKVLEKMADSAYQTNQAAQTYFKQLSVLQAVNDAIGYGQIDELVFSGTYDDLLGGINRNDYKSLSTNGQKNVCLKMAGDNYDKILDIKKAAIIYIEAEKAAEDNSNNGSNVVIGGSPISGGGMGSGTITAAKPQSNDAIPPQIPFTNRFTDLGSVGWATESVNALFELKIVTGRAEGIFAPNEPVTREEFLKMLCLAFQIELTDVNCSFTDVNRDDWYYIYVANATDKNLIQGIGNGTFGVGSNITRQDMAVMAVRMMLYLNISVEEKEAISFSDGSEINDYAKESVGVLTGLKIINGIGENRFAPKQFAQRAEAAKIIYEIYRYMNR